MRYYAGIGSRETPPEILTWMEEIANQLAKLYPFDEQPTYNGWYLRSGGAKGADTAFERGAMLGMDPELLEPWPQIFLPWEGFNGRAVGPDHFPPPDEAFRLSSNYHPAWEQLSRSARALHARNAQQVLGPNPGHSTPSSAVICWTPRGAGGGGTGQAIRIAEAFGIPVADLALPTLPPDLPPEIRDAIERSR